MFRRPRPHRFSLEQLEKRELLSGISFAYQPLAAGAADDFANTFAQAAALSVSNSGSATRSGTIERAGDVDMFKFVAPVTGTVTLQESAAARSRLDSYVYVYDASQRLIAQNDDYGQSLNSRVQFNVTAGTTYYIKAAAYSRSTGAYTIQFVTAATTVPTDDYANTIAQATPISLSSDGSATKTGKIEQAGDVDMFKVVATKTGTMTLGQSAASGSSLNSYLSVYNASGNLLAENNNNGSSLNSQIQISVVAGSVYYVKAAGYQTSTGAYTLQFSTAAATTPTPPTESGFQITATITGFSTAAQAVIQQAVDAWESIIVGDLPDVNYNGRVIDDIEISIQGYAIDSVGGILGQSTATAVRNGSDLPCMGYIQLDTYDVQAMLNSGYLFDVVEHELAHVLGFGVIWSDLGLLRVSQGSAGFTGANAVAAYNAIYGTNVTSVPVETGGGSGTAYSHWKESVFNTELMTGWYNVGQTNPLSAITIASMADLGYQVNMAAADTYARSASSVAASPSATRSISSFSPTARGLSIAVLASQANDNLTSTLWGDDQETSHRHRQAVDRCFAEMTASAV